jgi:hypothetical protein
VIYHVEARTFLPDFDRAAIRDLSHEFGLVILPVHTTDPFNMHYPKTTPERQRELEAIREQLAK